MAAEKILIVDDEILPRKNVGLFLRERGYEVTEATGGFEALEFLAKTEFDMVITDLVMPHIDGFRLIEIIHKRWPHVSVLLVTGYLSQLAGTVILQGTGEVISKPVDLTFMLATIERLFKSKRPSS